MGHRPRDPAATARVAIIGCGRIGSLWDEDTPGGVVRTHAGAYQQCKRARLAALCDTDLERLNRAGQRRGIRHLYTDYRQLFADEKLDLVSICTPPEQRLSIIDAALKSGVRLLFCEKPLALDLSSALAIESLLRPHDALMSVAYLRRWEPTLSQFSQAIKNGALGQIQSLLGRYDKGVLNNASHLLDWVLQTFGMPVRVSCLRAGAAPGPYGDPTPDVQISFAGARGEFEFYMLGSDYRRFSLFELDILGSEGRFQLLDKGRRVQLQEIVDDPLAPGYKMLKTVRQATTEMDVNLTRAVEELMDIYHEKAPTPSCTLDDAVRVMRVVDAIQSSQRSGGPVDLHETEQ